MCNQSSNDTLLEDLCDSGISDEETQPYTLLQASLIGFSAGLLSLATITGNLMVMISFKMDKQLQTISNYFLFSLAVADIIIGLISMPLFTVFLIQQKWTFGEVVCDTWLSVDYLASNASVMNLLVISFDRYFSVSFPLKYRAKRTTHKAALMIFAAWATSALVWPPWIFAWPYIEGKRTVPTSDCYIQFIYSNEYMSIVTVMIAFFIPVSVMIGLYVGVWWETVKRQKELVHLQADNRIQPRVKKRMSYLTTNKRETCNSYGGSEKSTTDSRDVSLTPNVGTSNRNLLFSLERSGRNQVGPRKMTRMSCVSFWSCTCIDREPLGDDPSSEGFATPKSIGTPPTFDQRSRSINNIFHDIGSLSQFPNDGKSKENLEMDDSSIYTILIRIPFHQLPSFEVATPESKMIFKTPSIQMLPGNCSEKKSSGETLRTQSSSNLHQQRIDSKRSTLPNSFKVKENKSFWSLKSAQQGSKSSLPGDVNIFNRKNGSNDCGNKRIQSEKKQDRKAAKTLSAILLAFIITWTPYSVLVILNACLGKDAADIYIPDILWQFSYYLCYINSTVNPILYALCNAAFRRTYVRILTCRWKNKHRYPYNRHFYS